MSQIVETRNGESVEVLDRGDLNRFLMWLIGVLIFGGVGGVWAVATQTSDTRSSISVLDTRLNNVEATLYERRELVRQVDSLRITLREAIGDLKELRRLR